MKKGIAEGLVAKEGGKRIIDFIKEARAAARLNHPNIVQSYAVGAEEGIYFFAMEYVEGTTLKDVRDQRQKLPWREAFEIGQQIAEGLDFGWKNQQLIHRDGKPDNIMRANNGLAKLADLGLARVAAELRTDEGDQVMGTPAFGACPSAYTSGPSPASRTPLPASAPGV